MMANEAIERTEQQMKLAPMRAVFICCNSMHSHVEYARQLAQRIGREDLEIWPPSMLDDQKNALRSFTGIVLDHAAMLTAKQIYTLAAAKARVNKFTCTCREFVGNEMKVEADCQVHGEKERA